MLINTFAGDNIILSTQNSSKAARAAGRIRNKVKKELENREKKLIRKLSIGEAFVYEGMLHLAIGVPESGYTFSEILNESYRLTVNLSE